MSDTPQPLPLVGPEQGVAEAVQAAPVALSAADALKKAREKSGLHVAALAAMLKVPVKKLEALEAGRFDELTDTTFVRALALSVCRQLKIDPTDILARLPQAAEVKLAASDRPVTRGYVSTNPSSAVGAGAGGSSAKPLLVAVGLVAAAAITWWFLPQTQQVDSSATVGVPLTPAVVAPVPETPPAPTAPGGAPADTTALSGAAQTVPAVPLAADASPTTGSNVATAAPANGSVAVVAAPAQPAPVTTAAPESAGNWLGIRVRDSAWVRVVDATGAVRVERLLQSGESLAYPTGGPFTVEIGRADVTDVWVRGQKMELTGRARLNVARFEVK
jgi:cytoskeleton protein RodZ